jgi:hypothetical protein
MIGVVERAALNPRGGCEVQHRRAAQALLPEEIQRLGQHFAFVELSDSSHGTAPQITDRCSIELDASACDGIDRKKALVPPVAAYIVLSSRAPLDSHGDTMSSMAASRNSPPAAATLPLRWDRPARSGDGVPRPMKMGTIPSPWRHAAPIPAGPTVLDGRHVVARSIRRRSAFQL